MHRLLRVPQRASGARLMFAAAAVLSVANVWPVLPLRV
jgi:hypothetical protein